MKNVNKIPKKAILVAAVFAFMLSNANNSESFTIKDEIQNTSLTVTNIKEDNLLTIKEGYYKIVFNSNNQEFTKFINN